MEIDLRSAHVGQVTQGYPGPGPSVCIVGGGIAGLVLADRLGRAGLDVLLLEAGGRTPDPAVLDEPGVELTGEPHEGSREDRPQALGGASLVWGGQLLPMPPADHDWPVSVGELVSFHDEVEELLGVDGLSYEAPDFWQELHHQIAPGLHLSPELAVRMSKFAPFGMRNLARALGTRLRASRNVRVALHARVTAVQMDNQGAVTAVLLRDREGVRVPVSARTFVLAAGTVESCRLLLASARGDGRAASQSLPDPHGQIGLDFHDHLTVEAAHFKGQARARAVALFRPWIVGGLRGTLHGCKLEAGEALRRELDLNPAVAHITFTEPEGSGLHALRGLLTTRQRRQAPAGADLRTLSKALSGVWHLRREMRKSGRRYIGPEVAVALRVNVAQRLRGRSRIALSERMDRWGEPLARVHWEHAPEDLRSIRVFTAYLRRQVGEIGLEPASWNAAALPAGPLGEDASGPDEESLSRPLPGLEDARHAMGGARMGIDPRSSVVDSDLKVHGTSNLYVASAAVFPDGRPQLPTMTLLALTLRLADHLQARWKR